jgi:DNA-binding HxlR family transcriptional regulator
LEPGRHFLETGEDAMEKMTLAECPIRATIKVIGAKWKPQILYKLTIGPHYFGELRRLLGASQKVLTQELRELEQEGIIERRVEEQETPHRVEYSLSLYGETLRPVLASMCDWGVTHRARHRTPDARSAKELPDSRDPIDRASPASGHAAARPPRQSGV